MRTDNHLDPRGIIRGRIWHIALVLVNLAPVLFYPLLLTLVFWLVVLGEQQDLLATIHRHDSPTITYICYVAEISNYEDNNGACSTSFNEIFLWSTL